jgi:hypothetical protein
VAAWNGRAALIAQLGGADRPAAEKDERRVIEHPEVVARIIGEDHKIRRGAHLDAGQP